MTYMNHKVTVSKGIYYFHTYELAKAYMTEHNVGLRIVGYDLGWAIQLRFSGPYVGE